MMTNVQTKQPDMEMFHTITEAPAGGNVASPSTGPVLIAVEDDDASRALFKWSLRSLKLDRNSSRVHLVHVMERPKPLIFSALGVPEISPPEESMEEELSLEVKESLLKTFSPEIDQCKILGVEVRLDLVSFHEDATSVGEVLVSLANKLGASCVVLGSTGKGVVKGLLLGSTSLYVARNSHKIPVVIVPNLPAAHD